MLLDNTIYAVEDREAFYVSQNYFDKELCEIDYEDYNKYINQYR